MPGAPEYINPPLAPLPSTLPIVLYSFPPWKSANQPPDQRLFLLLPRPESHHLGVTARRCLGIKWPSSMCDGTTVYPQSIASLFGAASKIVTITGGRYQHKCGYSCTYARFPSCPPLTRVRIFGRKMAFTLSAVVVSSIRRFSLIRKGGLSSSVASPRCARPLSTSVQQEHITSSSVCVMLANWFGTIPRTSTALKRRLASLLTKPT
jgi:hypothetical protein